MNVDQSPGLIWERPEPDERRASTPLTRTQVVAVAVRLGDANGLAAVSIRNVAAALGVRPMRLYSHVSGKDDLLELMIDAVHAEIGHQAGIGESSWAVAASEPAWRSQVRTLAHATRDTVRRHRWAIDLLGGRPHLGPHALDVGEATAAALARAPGRNDPRALRVAVGVLNSYLLGALRREIGELRASESSGLDTSDWQAALGPYLSRQLATGRLPTIEMLVRTPDPNDETAFEAELAVVLDSFARLPDA
ncbi:MAG: TetR/AcrR family transcriptional regulator [Microlunatus sp.]|nr:TetR/AcrR family transcriptional regulator [Microlunatus sp.]MDN5770673.1 TetR/AcrR family transcriptional regulator [Microlunatus sp.]MDN5803576.1 TetR/AcrR family transcriptional regulator [Microlunatus sp.]